MTRVSLDPPPVAAPLDARTVEVLAAQERLATHVRAHGLYVGHVEVHPSTGGLDGPYPPTVTVLAWRDPADWLAWVESLPVEVVRVHRRPTDTTLVAAPDHDGLRWRISGSLPRHRFPAWRVRPLHSAVTWRRGRTGRAGDEGWAPAVDVVAAVRELLAVPSSSGASR